MDPPIINESSFSAANPSAYSLSEIWPFISDSVNGGGLGLRIGNFGAILENGSAEVSTVTEQSNGRKRKEFSEEDDSSKMVSTSSDNELKNSNSKRSKTAGSRDESGGPKVEAETSSAAVSKQAERKKPSEPTKDYIHVRARRGQATDSHSLAERARREKISERMKILQDLVPGCNKVIGKALVLDEIINYIQSLQRQVEFLSMKLEAVNARMSINPPIDGFPAKELGPQQLEATGMMLASQATREYAQGLSQPEWLHMQLGGSFKRQS